MRIRVIFALIFIFCVAFSLADSGKRTLASDAKFWVHPVSEGLPESPDYEITVEGCDGEQRSFPYYSNRKMDYLCLVRSEKWGSKDEPRRMVGPMRYSTRWLTWSSFSMGSGSVTVRIKVKEGAQGITRPLKSCKVLPSSYEIDCWLESDDTIVFELDRPAKVFVIPNYDQAMEHFEGRAADGHHPYESYERMFEVYESRKNGKGSPWEQPPIIEGFRNPVAIMAHGPEDAIPNRNSPHTLMIEAGKHYSQEQLEQYDTLSFGPGVHDLSRMNAGPAHFTMLAPGQTVYLEAGAFVHGRFKGREGDRRPIVKGRGTLCGVKLNWIKPNQPNAMLNGCNAYGITVADRQTCGAYNFDEVRDVGFVGAWHPNTDGVELDHARIEDCLLMAMDDNLKILDNATARNLVIWQGPNAHPIMVQANANRDFKDCRIEDVDVIMYNKRPGANLWMLASSSVIACVRSGDSMIENMVFRNIRIESPFLYRVIDIYNLDTSLVTASWLGKTTEKKHTRVRNLLFDGIYVDCPLIYFKSLVKSDYPNSLRNVEFRNLIINGQEVDEVNKEDYFETPFKNAENIYFNPVRAGKGDEACSAF